MPGQKKKKIKVGQVVSNKAKKTIVVRSERNTKHPIYKKLMRLTSKFMAHDERNTCKIGDTVKIIETRPLSKRKRWRLLEIVKPAKTFDEIS